MKIVKEFVLREIAGENILVPVGNTVIECKGMISLTETGRFIWENVEKVNSIHEMVELVLEEYDIDSETAFSDTALFIMKLLDMGIIYPTNEDKLW